MTIEDAHKAARDSYLAKFGDALNSAERKGIEEGWRDDDPRIKAELEQLLRDRPEAEGD